MSTVRLREIAHARSGDKGRDAMVSIIPWKRDHYALLARVLTPERIKAHCGALVRGEVVRYDAPALGAFNVLLKDALGGGVTRTLMLDIHGKALSCLLLDMSIALPEAP